MQATVHTFDFYTGEGSILTDNGCELHFRYPIFVTQQLHHLRLGQCVNIRGRQQRREPTVDNRHRL